MMLDEGGRMGGKDTWLIDRGGYHGGAAALCYAAPVMTQGHSQDGGPKRGRLAALLTSPAMFLRDVDPLRGMAYFSPMNEESYRASSFLDNRIVRAGERDIVADLDDLEELFAHLHR